LQLPQAGISDGTFFRPSAMAPGAVAEPRAVHRGDSFASLRKILPCPAEYPSGVRRFSKIPPPYEAGSPSGIQAAPHHCWFQPPIRGSAPSRKWSPIDRVSP
jgi:hypothetical protein